MRLSLVVVCLALLACSPSVPNPDTGATTVPVVPVTQPVTITGEGTVNSRPFTLLGGHYTARWEARPPNVNPCSYIASLRPVVPNQQFITATLGNASVPAGGAPLTGETQVYSLPRGEYYVASVGSGCAWTVTLSPQVPQ